MLLLVLICMYPGITELSHRMSYPIAACKDSTYFYVVNEHNLFCAGNLLK